MKKETYIKLHRKVIKELFRTYNPNKNIPLWVHLHDLDKIIMLKLGVPSASVSKIHRSLSFHHPENVFGVFNYREMMYDWESARFSKPDKPMSAKETVIKLYPELSKVILPMIEFELKYS